MEKWHAAGPQKAAKDGLGRVSLLKHEDTSMRGEA